MDPPSSPPVMSASALSRKRECPSIHETGSTSSDPPVFSSDPPDPSLDNIAAHSKKRRYQGTWWGGPVRRKRSQDAKQQRRAAFARNFDSGVFMGSDSSEASVQSSAEQVLEQAEAHTESEDVQTKGSLIDDEDIPAASRGPPTALEIAKGVIQNALDSEEETIDVSGLLLKELPAGVFLPLRSITKPARFLDRDESPNENDFQPLKPNLQLFLANNLLCRLPQDIWNLDGLTVLSLRNNNLTELPGSIGRLRALSELNVAGNQLRWLPWELLSLLTPNGSLRTFTVLPNPLFKIECPQEYASNYVSLPSSRRDMEGVTERMKTALEDPERGPFIKNLQPLLRWHLIVVAHYVEQMGEVTDFTKITPVHIATSPIASFNFDGTLSTSSFDLSSYNGSEAIPIADETAAADQPKSPSNVPSLLELATRSAYSAPCLQELQQLLDENTPATVCNALKTALHVREFEGGRECSVCGKRYVLPRTEWIEFWHRVPVRTLSSTSLQALSVDEMFLPFLRRGCSPACVPQSDIVHKAA